MFLNTAIDTGIRISKRQNHILKNLNQSKVLSWFNLHTSIDHILSIAKYSTQYQLKYL